MQKEGKINAIYYILPQQVQVCVYAFSFFLLLYCTWAENCVRVLRFLSELHHKKAQAIILNSDSNFLLAHGK